MISPHLMDYTNRTTAGTMDAPIKIMVLEDDHGITDLLKSSLSPDCFSVTMFSSVQQGLDFVRSDKPDVIILVLDQPDPDGLRTCQNFRQSSRAPILVLSSNGKPNFAEQVLNQGADDYLAKPINATLIVASLNKLTRRAKAEHRASKHKPAVNPL